MFEAKILLDSISESAKRLTTMEITFPRIILAEFNTHRAFSRNSASSRAIPIAKMIQKVKDDPFIPTYWGANQKGMQANDEINALDRGFAKDTWLAHRDEAIASVESLIELNIHKQLANRLLEPWLWHTVIVTATDWSNFFGTVEANGLRDNPMAQPEMQRIASMMKTIYYGEHHIQLLKDDEWHMPLMPDINDLKFAYTKDEIKNISVARCARVSYLTHDKIRDVQSDLTLHERLISAPHLSPFEHVALPIAKDCDPNRYIGNFLGWMQYRKFIYDEADFSAKRRNDS
jgi:thymidylate synthase ThyX